MLPLAIYVASFVVHFLLLPYDGPGSVFHDRAFKCWMRPEPQAAERWSAWGGARWPIAAWLRPQSAPPSSLAPDCHHLGCKSCDATPTMGVLASIVDLNKRMLHANAGVKTTHNFGSNWLSWPLNSQPVFYWRHGPAGAATHRIYCAGNPYVWRLALCGGLVLVLVLLSDALASLADGTVRTPLAHRSHRLRLVTNGYLLLAGYLLGWLPFALVERVAFLYHYIPSLLLSILGLGLSFDVLTSRAAAVRVLRGISLRHVLSAALQIGAVLSLCYFAPLFYGMPMFDKAKQQRVVAQLETWWPESHADDHVRHDSHDHVDLMHRLMHLPHHA